MSYSALNTFRENYTKMVENEKSDDFTGSIFSEVPPGVKDLFKQFLDEGATHEDIMHLLIILSNTGSYDWDMIAHYFL